MNSTKYLIHVVCLFIIQLAILDNIQLNSYIYINIYILAILILPYTMKKTSVLLLAFLFGFIIDLANNTMGIHTAATTFIAYLRPKLLQLTSNRDQIDDIQGHKGTEIRMVFQVYDIVRIYFQRSTDAGRSFQFR